MILSHMGRNIDLIELRQLFPTSLKGANLQHLVGHAASLGVSARPVRLEMHELRDLRTPCILHWGLDHFVVLQQAGSRAIQILDPAIGKRRVSMAEASRSFTGVALELASNAEFVTQRAQPRVSLRQLTGQMVGLSGALFKILLVALAVELFAIVAPLLNQLVVDDIVTSNDAELLNVLMLGFGLLLLTQLALSAARSLMVLALTQSLSMQWHNNVFAHLLRLPLEWFERRRLGDITSRFGAVGAHTANRDDSPN